MLKVGLTGNIGSGKSMVARIFETLQVPVFYADQEAKKILDFPEVVTQLEALFGNGIIVNGKADRQALAQIVFADKNRLEQLNSIIHPAVRAGFQTWASTHHNAAYVVYEAAILHESGHYKQMDKVILVVANQKLRTKRVMQRDGLSETLVVQRMANQWPETKKIALSDFIINNNETELLIPQVVKIHAGIANYPT
ncbi:MAG: dephospho-CoA kinase [Bacteroidales bacterium]|nr:dephospho-CoA kinase [Bacteroidales bacterium]